jgi:phasin
MEIEMTKTNAKTTKPAADPIAASCNFMQAFTDAPTFEIPEAAREFVKRSASTAKERAAEAHTGANRFAGMLEGAVINYVTEVATVNRKLLEAAHQDAEAALVAIEKLAGAKSLTEAIQLNVDYLRERGEVGVARAKDTAAYVGQTVSGGVKAVQDGIAKVAPFARAA